MDMLTKAIVKGPFYMLQVYFSARSGSFGNKVWDWEVSEVPFGRRGNIWRRGVIESLQHDGGVEFSEGDAVPHADTVVYATGYSFSFPFLERAGVVKVADNRCPRFYENRGYCMYGEIGKL